jgi:ADP-ribose pyrophosphatase YjhB (NUDIX family)
MVRPVVDATMCYIRYMGEALFIHRTKGEEDMHNGFFVPPGGRTEQGERGIDGILREFQEETGLELEDPKLRVIALFDNVGRTFNGKPAEKDWRVQVYEARVFSGVLREEHPKAMPMWVPDREIGGLKMHEGDRKILDLLDHGGVFEVRTRYNGEDLTSFDVTEV